MSWVELSVYLYSYILDVVVIIVLRQRNVFGSTDHLPFDSQRADGVFPPIGSKYMLTLVTLLHYKLQILREFYEIKYIMSHCGNRKQLPKIL